MKKIIFLSTLFFSLIFQAQNIVKPGIYKSEGENLGVELQVNNDNTYQLIFMSGILNSKNDSIYLVNKHKQESKFIVNQFETNKNSSAIVVTINSKYIASYYNPVYIGTQKNDKSPVEYKYIEDYKPQTMDSTGYDNDFQDIVFSLDRVKYIYLVEIKDGIATSSKYEIKDTVSNLEIIYSPYAISNINLRGYINEENKLIITDGNTPIIFSLNLENKESSSNTLNPSSTKKDLDFVAPTSKYKLDQEYYGANENLNFDFKFVIDSNLKDALKTLQKTPNKFLVIAYNPNNKNENEEFKSFIKSQEYNVKSNMYDQYQPEYDLYNYYLATSKDKNLFDTKSQESQIVILNSNGDKLYNTTGTLSENQNLLYSYSQLSIKLTKANAYVELDKTVYNKKSSFSDLKTAFKNSLKIETPYVDSFAMEVVEAVDVDENEAEWATVAVDSAAVEVYEDYEKLKDEQNLYSFKTSKEKINGKWKQVLDHYKKQPKVDEDLVKIIKKEISNDGFTIKLFKERKNLLTDLDFESIDYLLNNYDAIIKLEMNELIDTIATSNYENYDSYYNRNLNDVLQEVFSQNSSSYLELSSEKISRVLNYYKKFVEISGNKHDIFSSYLYALNNNVERLKNKNELYSSYEIYYNSIVDDKKNIFESLDEVYTENYASNDNYSNRDWYSFKSSFSSLANTVAWSVVENEKDLDLIKKAIKWSETSLKLEKNNGYYLDTLAQLYYKNGQKEIAIKTQKQALENMKDYQDSDTYQEMQDVLTKMQNGSY